MSVDPACISLWQLQINNALAAHHARQPPRKRDIYFDQGAFSPRQPQANGTETSQENGSPPKRDATCSSLPRGRAPRVESCCLAGYSAPLATEDSRAHGTQRGRAPRSRRSLECAARLPQSRCERRDHPRSGDELSSPNPASAVRSPPGGDPRPPASARTDALLPALVQSRRARPTTRSPASTSDPNAASADPYPASAA